MTRSSHRPLAALRRVWLFVPGADPAAHAAALGTSADAIVADLEEMTAPADRPAARRHIVALLADAAACGALGAVRINTLAQGGHDDLDGVMPGRPAAIFLPHAETPLQLTRLADALTALEAHHGFPEGSTEIVPTIESAYGLVHLGAMLTASPRIRHAMLAVEDLAASLGARRSRDGFELLHARSRFLIECVAAGCTPIDLPCTYRAPDTLAHDLETSTRLGFRSKCAVFAEHVDAINRALTPTDEEADAARALLDAHRVQTAPRHGATATSDWINAPDANNARRLLERHALCMLIEHKHH
ncbi:HpcH/HpaI aldolase/citrate lyase family protein [Burkholderia cenocepacia]|uniref:CoA ester lyase n=1 Tax=Burkholderia cenocepacia TaxID=95486 RepID=A0ABD4UQ95_9BURK|nr:aldolase/citrate lyase family protein [Burkholderia cenocepacia]MCW3698563.1 CoA ester lyase [Burkholderia cenocepacia]MCW3708155.1 CoA ester lyase [Burkholderia cenocepacia]MCW3716199.1 CoA ester lyase [Burkholderia cenocepacia]MCW3724254.1 CoA ester lyase [Burkholderia cenocepacia]MCW3732357.1 CoA ester lyase [Burkholderia cenocepacia]